MGVVDTRPTIIGPGIRRRRKCLACGTRVTTHEIEGVGSAGILERAESVEAKAELVLAAAAALLESLDDLRGITKAHRTIEAARYGGAAKVQ